MDPRRVQGVEGRNAMKETTYDVGVIDRQEWGMRSEKRGQVSWGGEKTAM